MGCVDCRGAAQIGGVSLMGLPGGCVGSYLETKNSVLSFNHEFGCEGLSIENMLLELTLYRSDQ